MPETVCAAAAARLHQRSFKPALLAVALAGAFAGAAPTTLAQTLPTAGVAVHGQAAISNLAPNHLRVVTQNGPGTQHSAINWQSFSLSAGSTASFIQPSITSTVINRVVSNTPSAIFGSLSSNGRLVLVNQSGIAVGAGAVIDTAGFTASALRMSDADALAGRLRFGDANASMGGAAGITVGGRITARDGDVVLVAPNIDIGGSALLQAPNGSTILAAGQQVEITGRGLEGITLLVQAPGDQARNLGRLEGDAVGIFAGTLRHSGEIQATTATLDGGRVVLQAAGDAYVEGAGKVLATGGVGGRIDVLGNRVAVMDQAVIDVSGAQGGGMIRVGGDYQGKNPGVPNAMMTHVGVDTVLRADATQEGDGGRVIVWADDVTRAHGRISANAAMGGAGGFVETSGHRYLDVGGIRVTASGSPERPGTWLLDPSDITITHGLATGPYPSGGKDLFTQAVGPVSQNIFFPVASASVSTLTDGDLNGFLNGGSNLAVFLETSNTPQGAGLGDITFDGSSGGPIVIGRTNNTNTNANSLVFNADRNIVFSAGSTTFQRLGTSTGLPLSVQFNPGSTNAAGKVVTIAGASVVLEGVNDVLSVDVKNGKVWDNAGTVTMNGLSYIRLPNEGGYATFNNQATGVLNVNTSGTWSFLSNSNPQGGIVNNSGTINVNGTAGGNTTSWEAFYSNLAGGTLHLGAGKLLSMQNAATLGGSLVLDSGSELRLSQQFIGTPTISNALFSGPGKLSVASGVSANFSNNSGTLGQLDVQGTVGTAAGTLTVGDYLQSGGSFGGAGGLTVTTSFANAGGVFAPTGNLSITQASGSLVFNESAALNSLALSAPTGGITFGGALTVNANLALTAGGAISQTGGSLVVNGITTLNAPGSAVDLSLGSNDFLSIAGSTGALTVVDFNNLVVGAAGINSSNGSVNLSATGIGNLALTGNITAGSGNVTLSSHGPITQPGGAITGATLAATSSLGGISLPGANNVAAARFSASGGASVALNNTHPGFALSGTGGSLSVTGSGQVTVDQALNFASDVAINATTGISVTAALTSGGNLIMTTGTGLIEETGGGVINALGGTATFNAGAGDVSLFAAGNSFNVVNLAGQHISVVAANGLIVNSLASGANRNVYLQAGAGGMILPGTPVNAGAGQISFISGSSLLGVGSLTGSDIILAASGGLSIDQSINASGFLQLSAPGGAGISQAAGTSLVVGGLTTVNAGTGSIVLAEPGNNFSTVTATGGAITIHDANGLNFGAVNASTSLDVLTNGNVTQTAPLVISGTTAIDAGSGNVTLTTPGNNLNSLSINANAINVVEGAGSSLTVTALASGFNQPVRLVAGHTLTLPNSPINTGAGDLTLASNIGPLTIPAALNGNNITLGAVTGLTVNAPINATGNFNANVSNAASVTTINTDVIAAGTMGLTLAGGLELPAANQSVRLGAGTGQVINAKYIALTVSGSGTSEIYNVSGPQTITTSGVNGVGEGLVIRNTGTGADTAGIYNATGLQTITVNNADFVRVQGIGGEAFILSDGGQTLVIQGASSANTLQVGIGGSAHNSEIRGNNQSITVGQPGQSGSIQIVAGTADDRDSGIGNDSGTQTVKTVGSISIQGGSAPGLAGSDCLSTGAAHVGACGYIGQDGAGLQTVSAAAFNLTGGSSNSNNFAVIGSLVSAGGQLIEVAGGGNLNLAAGSGSGSGNKALIHATGPSQTINFVSGGNLVITGGTVGSKHSAGVYSTAAGSVQTVSGATGVSLAAGASGGGFGIGNSARLQSAGSQTITVGSSGLTLTGGGGSLSDNAAQIEQLGTGTQTINSSGAIVLAGGSSTGVNVGGTGHGSRASIYSEGAAQTINMLGANRSISLTGGTAGSRNFAQIFAENTGDQVISGASSITLMGGASGGVVGEGNGAYIATSSGSQTIGATAINLTGGATGTENLAHIQQSSSTGATTGTQSITVGGGGAVTLQGGGGTTNLARIRSFGATQTLNYSAGGSLNLTGGTGASLDFARVEAVNGNQNILGSPSIALAGGASGGADLSGNFASITANNAAATQTIVSSAMTLSAGAAGINNYAVIMAPVQNLTVHGNLSIAGGGSATSLDGTTGGGARIGASSGATSTLSLAVDNNITLTGGSVAGAAIGSNVQGGTTTAITITAGGNVTLNPGTAATAGARIGSPSISPAAGDIVVTAGGAIALNGVTAGETAVRTLGKVTLDGNTLALGNRVSGRALDLYGASGVTLSGPALLTASDISGTSILVEAPSGAFVNSATAGAGVLGVAGSARWLVYSTNPLNDTRGGLVYNFKQYDAVFADPVLGTGNGFLYSVVPTATASLVGSTSRTYDGGLVATLSAGNYIAVGIDGDAVVLNNPVAGTYDTKNVGTGKTVTSGGLLVASASNGAATVFGYNPVVAPASGPVGEILAAPVTVSYGATSKPFDGSAVATVTPSAPGLIGGDAVAVTQTASYADKNAGSGKPVSVSSIALTGTDAPNYLLTNTTASTTGAITALANQAWTGSGGDNLWSTPGNWAGSIVPDGTNVTSVSIPAGTGSVVFSNTMPATTLQSLISARPVSVVSGTLSVTSGIATDSYSQSGGTVNNAGNMTVASNFSQTGGTLVNAGTMAVGGSFSQSGGAIAGTGSLGIGGSFSQTAGSIAQGSLTIAQSTGNLNFLSLQATSLTLAAPAGAISQGGPLLASTLITTSQSGTTLNNGANQIGAVLAQNMGSGDIVIANTGALSVLSLDNAGGSIHLINTGGVTTIGAVSALGATSDVSLTANSPLTIGAGGVTAGNNVTLTASNLTSVGDLTINGPVSAGNQAFLNAGNNIYVNSTVFGANGVFYNAGGALILPLPLPVLDLPPDPPPIVAALEMLQTLVEPEPELTSGTNPDGSKKKRTDDTIVTEGEVCR